MTPVRKTAALLLVLVCLSCERQDAPPPPPAAAATPPPSAEAVVRELGRRMQQVSITAPPEAAARAIRETYSGLVHPRLLDAWATSPAEAPGRAVSSPWPERIEITSSSPSGDATVIRGEVVEMTSTGEAGRIPVELRLERTEGAWLVTAYEQTRAKNAAEDPEDAVAVVRDYYDAISARDFDRAYRYWGGAGPPGQTRESFEAGFADTKAVEVRTGAPSRVEPAAGSRYVEVPVTITATTTSGAVQRFEGTYTVRRSVVDGASPSQRSWHLSNAKIRRSE